MTDAARGRAAWRVLSLVWLPWLFGVPLAHADRGECDLDAAGMRTCRMPMTCAARADCIAGAGTGDETCQNLTANGSTSRECMHDCTTLFSCTSNSQCPTINSIVPTCSPVGPPLGAPSVCTWSTSSTSAPPSAQITYCTPPGNHIAEALITQCHRMAGSLTQFTTDYFRGDCDGDGCPNGHDTDPCAPATVGTSCVPPTAPFESPFCAPLPALACAPGATGLVCGDARPCNPASASILPCPIGSCEDGWSDGPRCRPDCGSLFLCTLGSRPGGGSPPEQCPMLDGATGVCSPLPASLAPVAGRDGICIYSSFFDSSCLGAVPLDACFVSPGGGFTSNYFAGDCDGDGAPNACDTAICMSGGETSACRDVVGAGCTPTYTPPSDAGVDGGSDAAIATDAATTPDSGSAAVDAASVADAGNTSGDASITMDGGIRAGFSGGGGCRCAAAGTRTRPWAGTALALLALGLVMRRRPRR